MPYTTVGPTGRRHISLLPFTLCSVKFEPGFMFHGVAILRAIIRFHDKGRRDHCQEKTGPVLVPTEKHK